MGVEPNVVIWAASYPQEVDEATNEGAPRMDNFCCIQQGTDEEFQLLSRAEIAGQSAINFSV